MIQALLILLVYIVGPIAILVWAVKRYQHGVRPSMQEWSVVAIAIVLMLLFAFSSTWNTTDRDEAELAQIVSELVQRYDFPVQAKFQERPAVEAYARPRRLEIHVYGVTASEEQAKVIAVITKLRRQIASKPVVVHFMRAEIWEEAGDGSRLPRRDREELMRKVRID